MRNVGGRVGPMVFKLTGGNNRGEIFSPGYIARRSVTGGNLTGENVTGGNVNGRKCNRVIQEQSVE